MYFGAQAVAAAARASANARAVTEEMRVIMASACDPIWRQNTESCARRHVRAGFVERRGSDVALICLGRTRGPWAAPRGVSGRRPLGGHGARSFFVPAHIPNYYRTESSSGLIVSLQEVKTTSSAKMKPVLESNPIT